METSHLGKYELFSLKLFKHVIEILPKCKAQQQHSTLKMIGVLCIESLQICDGFSGKAPPLSFEKMLLHFAKCCLTLSESETGVIACQALYAQLNRCSIKDSRGKSFVAEVQTLYKHASDMLWKASIHLEQKLGVPACEKCLVLRELALKCLLSSEDFELTLVLDRIIKADVHYHKLSTNESTNHSTSNTERNTNKDGIFKRLYTFHTSLLQHKDILSLIRADQHCTAFSSSLMYILHLVYLYNKIGNKSEALSNLKLAQSLCTDHNNGCHEEIHVFVHAQALCLQLWITLTETDELAG